MKNYIRFPHGQRVSIKSLKEACPDAAKASPDSEKAESSIEKSKRQDPKLRNWDCIAFLQVLLNC